MRQALAFYICSLRELAFEGSPDESLVPLLAAARHFVTSAFFTQPPPLPDSTLMKPFSSSPM
jgi:hypothetical protein